MEDIERKFDVAMRNIYRDALSECNYKATRFLQLVNKYGGLETAKILLRTEKYSEGLTKLWEAGRLDLTVEALVLKKPWNQLFSSEELSIARARLTKLGFKP